MFKTSGQRLVHVNGREPAIFLFASWWKSDASQCEQRAKLQESPNCVAKKTRRSEKAFRAREGILSGNKDRGLRGWKRIRFPNLETRKPGAPEFFAESFSCFRRLLIENFMIPHLRYLRNPRLTLL